MDEYDDIVNKYRGPKIVGGTDGTEGPFVLRPARLPDPTTIRPRQWLYGRELLRGFVTVLVAPGGTGKSVYAMTVAAAMAAAKELLGVRIFKTVRVAILNLEDPLDELERRLAAIMMRHGIDDSQLQDRLFLQSGDERALHMAQLDEDGFTVIHPDERALISQLKRNNIGLLVVDPFAESHTLEENSNPQMNKAAAAWRRIARAANCAVLLVHHVRKGVVADIDAARGAKALTDSARVGLLLSQMSEDDARQMGVDEDDRRSYVRLDNAKANLAPPGKASWYRLDQVSIGNADDDYPTGDQVVTMVAWEPENIWATTNPADLNKVLTAIAAGLSPDGTLYTDSRRNPGTRWAGNVLVKMLGIKEERAAQMIKGWLKSGLLIRGTYRDPQQRRERDCVRVDDSKRPTE